MHSFTDDLGREWNLLLNVGIMEEIESKLEVNLFDPAGDGDEPGALSLISPISSANIRRFANLLFLICEDQCKKNEISDVEFGKGLGSSIGTAYKSFQDEWMLFFQSLERVDLIEAMKKMPELIQEKISEVAEKIKVVTIKDFETNGQSEEQSKNSSTVLQDS